MSISYIPVNWTTYHDNARKIAATILSHNTTPIDRIVAITRGGLTFGHLLTDFLRVPIATFTIQSYSDIQSQGETKITEPLSVSIKDHHILLADDVSDTGTTFLRAIAYLKRFKPKKITTVAMFYKPHSVYRPDYFADQTSKWILFPYEPTEMILNITRGMEKEKKSKAEIQKKLMSLKYTPDQIKFVRKYHL